MSAFSAVDSSAEPARLISFLDQSAVGLAAMKHYMAVTHALRKPTAPVLDVGCGAGHDLTVLKGVGVTAVGVDPSALMLEAAARRVGASLAQASGERLPFADDVFSGCWIERVLMHVGDPAAVLGEAVRCVQPNGVLTIFEPDWSTLAVNGSPVPTQWISIASHPSVGAVVGELLTAAGCAIRDRVEECSWWTFSEFDRITNLERSLDRAVREGIATRSDVDAWLEEQHRRAATDDFRAEMVKILWVATTP
jgi:ubiquinone/menaquinone biosynthesis C-methylase UbiE